MPLYEYRCRLCNRITESIFKIGDKPADIQCEHCHGPAEYVVSLCSDLGTKYYSIPNAFKEPFFGSYADKKKKMKEEGLIEAGDRVGGSRDGTSRAVASKEKEEVKRPGWLSAEDDKKMKVTVTDSDGKPYGE